MQASNFGPSDLQKPLATFSPEKYIRKKKKRKLTNDLVSLPKYAPRLIYSRNRDQGRVNCLQTDQQPLSYLPSSCFAPSRTRVHAAPRGAFLTEVQTILRLDGVGSLSHEKSGLPTCTAQYPGPDVQYPSIRLFSSALSMRQFPRSTQGKSISTRPLAVHRTAAPPFFPNVSQASQPALSAEFLLHRRIILSEVVLLRELST